MNETKMEEMAEKWEKGNYGGCVATYTKNYISYFACNGDLIKIGEALYKIAYQYFGDVEASLRFLDEIEQWIDEVGVNDSSEGTYMIAETLNGKTEVFYNGDYEAFTINFPNLVCEMAHYLDTEPAHLLSVVRTRSLDYYFR